MKALFFYLTVFVAFSSCSKKSADTDTELPVIIINDPAASQVYLAGQKINISGSVTDNKSIAEIHIHVNNINTGTLYLDVHLFPGTAMSGFSNQDLSAASGISYRVEIIAIDRSANEARSHVDISCN